MSTRYIIAVRLLDRSVFIDHFSSLNLNQDSIWDLVGKMKWTWNADFDRKSVWHTRVSVISEDGETAMSEVTAAESTAFLMSEDRIKEK